MSIDKLTSIVFDETVRVLGVDIGSLVAQVCCGDFDGVRRVLEVLTGVVDNGTLPQSSSLVEDGRVRVGWSVCARRREGLLPSLFEGIVTRVRTELRVCEIIQV